MATNRLAHTAASASGQRSEHDRVDEIGHVEQVAAIAAGRAYGFALNHQ
jgi:hypothetical protein